jgi:hypothetical protein
MGQLSKTLIKTMVLRVVNELLEPNNTITTLEIKNKLREEYPDFHWTQSKISSIMIEFSDEGRFTYEDNGTFRTYSDPKKVNNMTKNTNVKPVQQTASKTASISRHKATDLIKSAGGSFFTVTFLDKKGDERTINGQYLKDQQEDSLGYIKVKELAKAKYTPNDCIRSVNLQTIKKLKINGQVYKVK